MKAKTLDFLVIGAHKAGTTALFHYLRRHPRLFLPPEKEAGFFSNDYWWNRSWNAFADEFFAEAPVGAMWGKVTPQYMAYPEVPARIRVLMPDVKLVAILRNPVDRAYSHYRMAMRTLAERRSFEDAVVALQRGPYNPTSYLAMGQYGRILSSYLAQFPTKQLLTVFTEDLDDRPQFVLDVVARYVGVSSGFTPSNLGRHYHVGGTRHRYPWLMPLAKRVPPVWWLWKRFPERRRRIIRFWFETQVATTPTQPIALQPRLRDRLVEYYRTDVHQMEAILGMTVPWKEFHQR